MKDHKRGFRNAWKRLQMEGFFVTGLATGVLISIAVALALGLTSSLAKESVGTPTNWLYHYQTLASGVLAVMAAVASIWMLNHQITAEERREKSRRAARKDATLSVLPVVLSDLCEYSQTCFTMLATMWMNWKTDTGHKHVSGSLEVPTFPADALTSIKEVIEYLEEDERVPFRRLAADLQVLRSRLGSLPGKPHPRAEFETYALNCAEIYAQASGLFDFSRPERGPLPGLLSKEAVGDAVGIVGIQNHELSERLSERVKRSKRYSD